MVWSVCVLCLCNFLIFNYWYLVPCGTEIQGPNKERSISLCSLVFSTTVIKLRSLLKYKSGLDKDIEIASTSRATSTSTINATLHHKSKIYEHSIKFEQQVLKELNVLNLKLDGISECVNVLINNTANKTQTSTSISYEIPEEILESLPVNDQSLVQLENWLSCEKNKTILSQNLSRIGGFNVKEIVRRIMYRVFTNEVGMCYSWEGAKKKKIFLNLAIATTILSAV
ncbi:uncharacterized protein LOC105205137 [Solenopsis invicta]|uniref:uncharacterized protein LOC105205137 n=1 Tax=Solenopsis invicta TaxID=13686 RepID=UPI00193CA925|nr:uncharacterized protein LOC105205137 [Solenopsis invicta]XP_039303201.1 uncharacterized protein LOC105205137 [Solenopsis invicta]